MATQPNEATLSMLQDLDIECRNRGLIVNSHGYDGAFSSFIEVNYTDSVAHQRILKGETPLQLSHVGLKLSDDPAAAAAGIMSGPHGLGLLSLTTPSRLAKQCWAVLNAMKLRSGALKVLSLPEMIRFLVLARPNFETAKLSMLHPIGAGGRPNPTPSPDVALPAVSPVNGFDTTSSFGEKVAEFEAAIAQALLMTMATARAHHGRVPPASSTSRVSSLKHSLRPGKNTGVPTEISKLAKVRELVVELLADAMMDILAREGANIRGGYWGNSGLGPEALLKRVDGERSVLRRLEIFHPGGPYNSKWEKRNTQNEAEAMRLIQPDVINALKDNADVLKEERDGETGLNFDTSVGYMMMIESVEFLINMAPGIGTVNENKQLWANLRAYSTNAVEGYFSSVKTIGRRNGRGIRLSAATDIAIMSGYSNMAYEPSVYVDDFGNLCDPKLTEKDGELWFLCANAPTEEDDKPRPACTVAPYGVSAPLMPMSYGEGDGGSDTDAEEYVAGSKSDNDVVMREHEPGSVQDHDEDESMDEDEPVTTAQSENQPPADRFYLSPRPVDEVKSRALKATSENGPGSKHYRAIQTHLTARMQLGIDTGREVPASKAKRARTDSGPTADLRLAAQGLTIAPPNRAIHGAKKFRQ
ncbi:hypothetical protein H9P43_003690 [Blastocladiella emersonii ATCC 22665]|nr:hypothetical protein H9P43_003690 [Blastocladiella emersonii ATCC 22665]